MSTTNPTTPTNHWETSLVAPRDLYRSPDLALLCAKDFEGQFYERKSKRSSDRLAETICAFANSNREHGGLLAVGISDDGRIDGIRHRSDLSVNKLLEYHYHTGARTDRKFVDCMNKNGLSDHILLIYVPYLEDRVAETSKGKAFVREGHETIELRDTDRRELEYSKGQISLEDEEACLFSQDVIVGDILEELKQSICSVDQTDPKMEVPRLLVTASILGNNETETFT